jgi:ABC-type transporter Mla MlaB component
MILLPNVVNHQNAIEVRQKGLTQITNQENLIDASALNEFDSSIMAVLLAWLRINPNLQIVNAPDKLKVLTIVYGLDEVLQLKVPASI